MSGKAGTSDAVPAVPNRLRMQRFVSDRLLGWLSAMLLLMVVAAIIVGRDRWVATPPTVWAHLLLMAFILLLTPLLLLRAKGTRQHRLFGWAWVIAMMASAAISFGIRLSNDGRLSWIHLLSAWTLVMTPMIAISARAHHVELHRKRVRTLVIFALLLAGALTFPFGRMMGRWLGL